MKRVDKFFEKLVENGFNTCMEAEEQLFRVLDSLGYTRNLEVEKLFSSVLSYYEFDIEKLQKLTEHHIATTFDLSFEKGFNSAAWFANESRKNQTKLSFIIYQLDPCHVSWLFIVFFETCNAEKFKEALNLAVVENVLSK